MFGKRTFLVRHGRRPTCAVSALCWTAGVAVVTAAADPTPALVAADALLTAAALALLAALARTTDHRRQEVLISTLAIIGRMTVLGVLAQPLGPGCRLGPPGGRDAGRGAHGTRPEPGGHDAPARPPRTRLRVPAAWTETEPAAQTARPDGSA